MTRWLRRLFILFLGLAVLVSATAGGAFYASCPGRRAPTSEDLNRDFIFDAREIAEKSRIAILIPGALNSISIFDGAKALREQGFAIVLYRFPGMDGRPVDRDVEIASVARQIGDLAARYGDKAIYLVGFSLGGQIALEAAAMLQGRVSKVVVLSGAAGFPTTFAVGFYALGWVGHRAWSLGTLDFGRVWKEFYKVLLFGPAGATDATLSGRADRIIASRRDKIVTPTPALACAHMADLVWRRSVMPDRLAGIPVGFFHGEHDVVLPLESAHNYASGFRNGSFDVLQGQGHLIFVTAPDLFDRVAAFFLAPPPPRPSAD
jgi:pimeloyl-ACP methyl ester carboxylesterase